MSKEKEEKDFIYYLSNRCLYDFDSIEDCHDCYRKEKCWKEAKEKNDE